jgi:hypothetical protein
MREARRGLGWVVALGCFAACSSSGVVLETKKGEPVPQDSDAGAVSSADDAGPLKGVDSDSLRSGNRIHIRVHVSDGEVISVVGLHDTLRDVDCYLDAADDGVTRCLPEYSSLGADITPGVPIASPPLSVFADADCTERLLRVDPQSGSPPCYNGPSTLPPYVTFSMPADHCSQRVLTQVVAGGAQIQSPSQLYSTDSGSCQPTTVPTSSLIYASSPSPASDWVAFQKTVKPLTSRLGVIQWSGSDGSLFPGDTVLLPNDESCGPGDPHSSVPPGIISNCIPSNVGNVGGYFSDAACTAEVAVVDPNCELPELLAEYPSSTGSCSVDALGNITYSGNAALNYFALGDAIHSTVYTTAPLAPPGQPSMCTPASSDAASAAGADIGGSVAYAKGAPVDPASYPPMQMVLTGSGRIRHYEWQSEGVSIGDAGNLVDAMTGAAVTPTAFDDGVMRGVFSTTGTDKFFSDPNCKTWMLDIVTANSTGVNGTCPPMEIPRWVSFAAIPTLATACDGDRTQSSVRPVLSKHTGKVYTLIPDINVEMNGACSEYVPSKSDLSYDFYDLGNPVPASSLFAEIKTVDL